MVSEIGDELERFKTEFDTLRISTLLSGPYDKDNAIYYPMPGQEVQKPVTGRK